jgi:hypothetical protein
MKVAAGTSDPASSQEEGTKSVFAGRMLHFRV